VKILNNFNWEKILHNFYFKGSPKTMKPSLKWWCRAY